MFIKYSSIYLSKVQNFLITNQFILSIVSLFEILPLIYNMFISSFYFSSFPTPPFFEKYVYYISIYDIFRKHFPTNASHYPFYCFIVIFMLFISYFLYRYFLLPKVTQNINKLNQILINVYEFLLFRVFSIFYYEIIIKELISQREIYYIILILILMFLVLSANFIHFNTNYLYIDLNSKRNFHFDNSVLLICDCNYIIIKLMICLSNATLYTHPHLHLFSNVALITANIYLIIHESFLLFYNKSQYMPRDIYLNIRCFVSNFMLIMQLIIIFSKQYDTLYFIYCTIQSMVLSIGVTVFWIRFSKRKIMHNENYMGMVVYLLKERNGRNIKKVISDIINRHRALCYEDNCKVCKKVKNEKNISAEMLAMMLYRTLIKKRKSFYLNKLEYKEVFFLVDLYMSFVSTKRNLIKIMFKYNKIKVSVKNSAMAINEKLYLKSHNKFSINFYINLDLLFHEITECLLQNNDNQKLTYLIITDKYSSDIKAFIKYLRNFFILNLRTPQEIIVLAKRFTTLLKKINFDYLISKENKFMYPCIINGYIMEEIFNNNLNAATCIEDAIQSMDELLDFKYKEDSLLLATFDIHYNKIVIKSTGRDLIYLKNQTFEKMFPPFIRKEGLEKLLQSLKQNHDNYFEFYYINHDKGTIDKFKMKFMGIPSPDFDSHFVYIACNYLLEKDNFLLFEVKNYLIKDNKILAGISETISHFLNITPDIINTSYSNKTYLTFDTIFHSKSKEINYKLLQHFLKKKFFFKNLKLNKKKNFIYILKEKIGSYEVYLLRDKDNYYLHNKALKKENSLKTQYINFEHKIEQENIEMTQEDAINFFEATHTGMSSSQVTHSGNNSFAKEKNTAKNEQTEKYKKFFIFTYILLIFNFCILLVISLFLGIQLMNNIELEQTFIIIKNFNDFQSYFFHAALSVFSLTCNADYLSQEVCCNQFTEFCINFSLDNGLTMNELMNDYLARELTYKSDLVISALKTWERDRYLINSKELDDILEEEFTFCLIEEVDLKLSIVSIKLNFEEAIKRFINLVNLIPSYENHLTSVIWTVTSNGYEEIDLTNVMLDKRPIYGVWLTEVQKHYYACLLNFQKYLLRMFSMADLLFEYYENKISHTQKEIFVFIVLFIVLHLIMFAMSLVFVFKYKILHMGFFVMIFVKMEDFDFKIYYDNKMKTLLMLLELYKKNPNELINHIKKIKLNEKKRIQNEIKLQKMERNIENKIFNEQNIHIHSSVSFSSSLHDMIQLYFNKRKLNSIYNKTIIFGFLLKLTLLFMGYIIIIIILYIITLTSIDNLSLMNKYIKNNYDSSNNIYLNLALIQIMSLTNQTDVQMDLYFGNNDSINNQANDGYVRRNLQKTSEILSEIDQMERHLSYFKPLSSFINLNCETLYNEIQDPIINAMIEGYPKSNYVGLLAKYCYVYSNLRTYQDDKMTLNIITYKTSKVLDLFLDQTYETYQIITNCLLIYQIYTEILMIVRPIRRYLYEYLIEDVIKKILNNHSRLIIIFLLINFSYEIMILICIKLCIIDKIIQSSKEIIVVAKAFECI